MGRNARGKRREEWGGTSGEERREEWEAANARRGEARGVREQQQQQDMYTHKKPKIGVRGAGCVHTKNGVAGCVHATTKKNQKRTAAAAAAGYVHAKKKQNKKKQ